ncbi:hypothetical protein COHA_004398 [Chlorella ohadii]|uniref:SGNH hydrolase-type esterase domain-containing protein n=1 Tax=Chlorella ohadii TaxID=2649997 RepID=A0AAD5DT11_9CHLO|nr:hypothetical protein COHA_004398 [Chlorella ohadii]
MGAEELLPLRGSPSHSSTDGSRRGSPERGSGRSVLQAFPQTGGLSAFAAFVTGALLVACLLLATGSVQWSRESVVPLRTTLSTSGGAGQASPNGAAQQQLRLPWPPLLSAADVQRGITYHGTGARLQAVAAKLLAGQPIKAYTLGGSVTKGQGASTDGAAYPHRFFEFIRAAFPHSKHVLLNKGIGGTSSGIFAACAEQLVAPDADLVFVEFTVNDRPDLPLTDPQRKGFEQLLRKLLRLPGRPAVVLLHHYPWWRASGDGRRLGLFYYPLTEQHFTLLAHYYDLPSVSVRAALYPLMINAVDGFKVDKVTQRHRHMPNGRPLPAAAAEERASYFYADRTHPNDRGHQVLAELLAGLVLGAAHEQQRQQGAGKAEQHAVWAQRSTKVQQALTAIPPPMIPGNAEEPTSLCAIQEAFQSVVVAHQGFEWRAERPEEATCVGQKWAWTASQPGDWAELQFDSRDAAGPLDAAAGSAGAADASPAEEAAAEAADEEEEEEEEEAAADDSKTEQTAGAGKQEETAGSSSSSSSSSGGGSSHADSNSTAASGAGAAPKKQPGKRLPNAEVLLSHLRSYEGMGVAQVRCVAGCTCSTTYLDGTWEQQATLQYIHRFKVSQHADCRVRVRVMSQAGSVPQEGHKVSLMGLMVSHIPIRMHTRDDHAEQLSNITRRLL